MSPMVKSHVRWMQQNKKGTKIIVHMKHHGCESKEICKALANNRVTTLTGRPINISYLDALWKTLRSFNL